ncbi:MAG TPA: DUF4254 domain-containing protein, partial [Burkholderiales bacterium]
MIRSAELIAFHDGAAARPGGALWDAVETNHRENRSLWDEEDLARRRNVPDSEIAKNKRAIDGFNQKRNDATERIDELLLKELEGKGKSGARLNSETAGAMVDRLSILSLKIRAMRLQTERTDVDQAHIETCRQRLARLAEQRGDLAGCLDRLLAEAARGESTFKVYRQYKMYNDPK